MKCLEVHYCHPASDHGRAVGVRGKSPALPLRPEPTARPCTLPSRASGGGHAAAVDVRRLDERIRTMMPAAQRTALRWLSHAALEELPEEWAVASYRRAGEAGAEICEAAGTQQAHWESAHWELLKARDWGRRPATALRDRHAAPDGDRRPASGSRRPDGIQHGGAAPAPEGPGLTAQRLRGIDRGTMPPRRVMRPT